MEFIIKPSDVVKCYTSISIATLPGRNYEEKIIYRERMIGTLQNCIEDNGQLFGNIFRTGGDILGFHIIIRMLLPMAMKLELFETEKEIDLYVGTDEDCKIYTVTDVPENVISNIKSMVKH